MNCSSMAKEAGRDSFSANYDIFFCVTWVIIEKAALTLDEQVIWLGESKFMFDGLI